MFRAHYSTARAFLEDVVGTRGSMRTQPGHMGGLLSFHPSIRSMSPRQRWFLWRFVVSALSIPFALCIFIHDWGPGTYPFGLFALAGVSLMTGIMVWFYRHPDGDRDRAGTQTIGPRTPHEIGKERDMAAQNELNRIGLSGYWVDRRYFGRFKGPKD